MTSAPKAGDLLFARPYVAPPGTPGSFQPILATGEINWNTYEADPVERPVVGLMGVQLPALHAAQRATATFPVGLVGSGTQGVAPAAGPLFEACAMGEAVVEDESVTYTFIDLMETAETPACDLICYESGQKQQCKQARGTATLTFPSAGIPTAEFNFTGNYATPETEAIASPPDFGGQSLYKLVGQNTTLTLISDGDEFPLCFESFAFTFGAAVEMSTLGNCEQRPEHNDIVATWNVTAIRSASDLDLWSILEDRYEQDLSIELRHGIFSGPNANPGYRVSLDLTQVFLDGITKAQIKQRAARGLSGTLKGIGVALTFD